MLATKILYLYNFKKAEMQKSCNEKTGMWMNSNLPNWPLKLQNKKKTSAIPNTSSFVNLELIF